MNYKLQYFLLNTLSSKASSAEGAIELLEFAAPKMSKMYRITSLHWSLVTVTASKSTVVSQSFEKKRIVQRICKDVYFLLLNAFDM